MSKDPLHRLSEYGDYTRKFFGSIRVDVEIFMGPIWDGLFDKKDYHIFLNGFHFPGYYNGTLEMVIEKAIKDENYDAVRTLSHELAHAIIHKYHREAVDEERSEGVSEAYGIFMKNYVKFKGKESKAIEETLKDIKKMPETRNDERTLEAARKALEFSMENDLQPEDLLFGDYVKSSHD